MGLAGQTKKTMTRHTHHRKKNMERGDVISYEGRVAYISDVIEKDAHTHFLVLYVRLSSGQCRVEYAQYNVDNVQWIQIDDRSMKWTRESADKVEFSCGELDLLCTAELNDRVENCNDVLSDAISTSEMASCVVDNMSKGIQKTKEDILQTSL